MTIIINTPLPKKRVIDTNVPKIANLKPEEVELELNKCVKEAIFAIECFTQGDGIVVLDEGEEIFEEYIGQLNLSGQPGLGDIFVKWIHDNRFTKCERVQINREGDSYREFPDHEGLKDFDPSDRKFIAVANAHPEKPPILEGTDSKWWGWKDALKKEGITVIFLDEKYVAEKWEQKIGS